MSKAAIAGWVEEGAGRAPAGGEGGETSDFPADWRWSANFADSGTYAQVDGHAWEYSIGSSSQVAAGVQYVNQTGKSGVFFGADIDASSSDVIPAMSSSLEDTRADPNGTIIALVNAKYLTIYFQIDHASDTVPGSVFGHSFYWSGGTTAQYNTIEITPFNTVRKTGSHDGVLVTASEEDSSGGSYSDLEYLSVTYDMTDQDDAIGQWGAVNNIVKHIGGTAALNWSSGAIIVHGYVLSEKNNKAGHADYSAQISDIDLPISTSAGGK